jgi:hypothetical protein
VSGSDDNVGRGPASEDDDDEITAAEGFSGEARSRWWKWRHRRPFWGAVLVILGAGEILLSERAPLPLVIHIGLQGLAGYLVPLILLLCGVLLLINPVQRMFYAVLAIGLALLSWVTSNLGGFFIGMLLGVIGGALALAWTTTGGPRTPRLLGRKPSSGEPSAGLDLILKDRDSSAHVAAQAIPRQRSWATRALPASPLAIAIIGVAMYHAGPFGQQASLAQGVSLAASASVSPSSSVSPSPLPSTPSPTASVSPTPTATPTPTVGVGPSPVGKPPQPGRAPPGPPRVTARLRGPGPGAVAWTLTAGSAVVTGLTFDGVARVRTERGAIYMLKFSLGSMVLSGGTGLTFAEDGRAIVTQATSLDLSGNITLYATKISGELHGRMVVYTPRKPPVNLGADLTLANVVASQPYATADTFVAAGLTITEPAS